MQRNAVEAIIGAVVLAVALGFVVYASGQIGGGGSGGDSYRLSASFASAGGIGTGADVRLAGVRIGSVSAVRLDPDRYRAIIDMDINGDIVLPEDSAAQIASDGLLGGALLTIEAGISEDVLGDGDVIGFTNTEPGLIQLLGQAIFSMSGGDDSSAEAAP